MKTLASILTGSTFDQQLITHEWAPDTLSTHAASSLLPLLHVYFTYQVCRFEPRFGACGIIKKFRVILSGY